MSSFKEETIKQELTDMMYDTSVTIIILSPNLKDSDWIEWEVQYCLKKITRKNRTSQRNGLLGVIKKVNGDYSWLKYKTRDGGICYHTEIIPEIIKQNRNNSNPAKTDKNGFWDWLNGSYIAFIEEDEFLNKPQKYINNAYEKCENDADGYDIEITV